MAGSDIADDHRTGNGQGAADAIRIHQLTKKYGELVAVDAVDLTVPAGSVVSLYEC